ncbi:3-alpha-hydroxysteroid sulfotransferase [Cavia porcellus]|uniref:3-alpha-hydroxysteroid sulfotransferase n=1 Tax=Cavia porcellus TaxID=10141 RepID=SUHA_CAVPO|nr:3-alpha-hydroxysteroid sulfotransferase [Cavia porcellus]P50234.2 RecName: Full=3-alpha-hydroxysteroid sulfotransferase; AltName: Full=Alcohol sulfotransferase; AltName: Full=HST1 [Cavia porcellus]AAA19588.1 3 alpha-hydroxysteroid sulfotransferase [Cavia porcellus]
MSDNTPWFEGIRFPMVCFSPEILREVRDKFLVKDEDTITVTYPKSGTNWLNEIVCLILSKGDPKLVQSVPNWDRSPWIEFTGGYELVKGQKDPRVYTSHLPLHLFPKSFFSSKAKVIYCIRNPRDALVSGYFFLSKMNVTEKPETLQQYMEWFLQGNVIYGSWFEHVRGWLSMREMENVLVLSYEDLIKDTRSTVEKICQFLGKKLKPEETDLVLKYSSFQFMKENEMSNFTLLPHAYTTEGFTLLRKGTVGDWKNHFTVAQAEAFDKIYQEKMAGYPPKLFSWEEC